MTGMVLVVTSDEAGRSDWSLESGGEVKIALTTVEHKSTNQSLLLPLMTVWLNPHHEGLRSGLEGPQHPAASLAAMSPAGPNDTAS